MTALVLFGVSSSTGVNAFIPAAILMGLGNITFHLAQFHISALFPRSRGLIASIFVAGFTGCGIIMYLLMLIFESAGGTRYAFLRCQSSARLREAPRLGMGKACCCWPEQSADWDHLATVSWLAHPNFAGKRIAPSC